MSSDRPALADWIRLTLVPGIGSERQRRLIKAFGLPAHIFNAGHAALAGVIGDTLAHRVREHDAHEATDAACAWAGQPDNHIVTLADAAYPQSLLDLPDPPTVLYVKGSLAILNAPALAIVGARSASPPGTENAAAFAESLARSGLVVISGLALGIDAAAHRGALRGGGKTVAVIGTGADRVYPARNKALAQQILDSGGALVSEFPLGTPAAAHNFPRRNRIIAGLSRGVLVVEAALGSGSLITARLANEQGRDVFAIPGSIHSPLSKGCHHLIREGAKLVETAQDILEERAFSGLAPLPATPQNHPTTAPAVPQKDEAQVLDAMGHDPVNLDTLAGRTGLTTETLYAMLLEMELCGRLARLPGGRFQRL